MAMGPAQSAAGVAGGCGLDDEANAMRATVTRPSRWRLVAAAFAAGLLLAASDRPIDRRGRAIFRRPWAE
jgi:hypothetical protein